jgi:hypothetical protein
LDGAIARPRKERPQEAKREMLATARDYKRRAKELERAGTRLQRDRDKAIRKAVKGGMPVADVGDAFGLSQQRGRCRPRDALRRGNPRDGPEGLRAARR